MAHVFVLQHRRIDESGGENLKMIGVYGSRVEAERAVGRLRALPGFRDSPDIVDPLDPFEIEERSGFHIDEYALDEDHWTEGFGAI
jgi:hypothetical protein